MTPQRVAEITGGKYVGHDKWRDTRIDGAVRDDRDVEPRNLFVCIKGQRADGHDFANRAYSAGAVCCLAEREIKDAAGAYVLVPDTLKAIMSLSSEYRKFFDIPFIGITGSVGKTTGKEMIASVLSAKYNVAKTLANLNNDIGVPLTLLSINETHEVAVVEMGINNFGDMTRLTNMVKPDIMALTKIGYAHLDNLGDLDGVFKAKTEVFPLMDAKHGIAIINGDDDYLTEYDPGMKTLKYGFAAHNDYRAENVSVSATDNVSCDIIMPGGRRFTATIPSYGAHLVMAALAATAVGDLMGLSESEIARGLLSYAPVGGRANVKNTGFITLINDSYNANPHSVRAALDSLATLCGRRVAVLGDMLDMAEYSDELHLEVGACALNSGVERLICHGEQARLIVKGYIEAGGSDYTHFDELDELIAALPSLLQEKDIVLVKASRSMGFIKVAERLSVL